MGISTSNLKLNRYLNKLPKTKATYVGMFLAWVILTNYDPFIEFCYITSSGVVWWLIMLWIDMGLDDTDDRAQHILKFVEGVFFGSVISWLFSLIVISGLLWKAIAVVLNVFHAIIEILQDTLRNPFSIFEYLKPVEYR